MHRIVDVRDLTVDRATPERRARSEALAAEVSERLSGEHRISVTRMDAKTGNPAVITSTAAPAGSEDFVARALDHVTTSAPVLGLAAAQAAEVAPEAWVARTSSGARVVHLQPQHQELVILESGMAVHFAPSGTLLRVVGSCPSFDSSPGVAPQLTVIDAVRAAGRHVAQPAGGPVGHRHGVDLSGWHPTIRVHDPDQPALTTLLDAGPFDDDLTAKLVWFPADDGLSLAWEVVVMLPGHDQYESIVDARSGTILSCQRTTHEAKVMGNVRPVGGSSEPQLTEFPRPLSDYPIARPSPPPLPADFPRGWVTSEATLGSSTIAHKGYVGEPLVGRTEDGAVVFEPDELSNWPKVLNAFYLCCYMHDYFYLLGFREADGCFQEGAVVPPGAVGGPLHACVLVLDSAETGAMVLKSGHRPSLLLNYFPSRNGRPADLRHRRHSAFDPTIVFHEYTHGVADRLVGGVRTDRPLRSQQSKAMGEGWGDFIACTVNGVDVIGAWVAGKPGGLRDFRYDAHFPDHFDQLGTGRYDGRDLHNVGEIWCATLIEMSTEIGQELAVQLVVDAMKLSAVDPSFLIMRDHLFSALADMRTAGQLDEAQHAAAWRGMWEAFARYGMGPAASSIGGTLTGIVPDFTTPPAPLR